MSMAVRQYRFPPFPPAPEGVKIVPFKAFTEYGTRVVGPDEVERDGLGIPTIALPKKEKNDKTVVVKNGPSVRKDWWEDWKTTGPLRGSYDPKLNRDDRFYRAATEFAKHYSIHKYQHLQVLWDTFRSFVGLNLLTGSHSAPDADENLSDDDEIDVPAGAQAPEADVGPVYVSQPDTSEPPTEDKIAAFLNNPEASMKVFFSSYMHERGQMWAPNKLVSAPRLMRFFVDFLLLNKVLPENAQGLADAHRAIDLAMKELPLRQEIADALPDAFSVACQAHWGSKADSFVFSDPADSDCGVDEPKAKRTKITHSADEDDHATVAKKDSTDAQDVEDDISAPQNDGGWGSGGWGNGGWGTNPTKSEAGFTLIADTQDDDMTGAATDGGWGAGSGWGASVWGTSGTIAKAPPVQVAPAKLEIAPRPTLVTLLGPTALPLTHAPGIVERSLRRIKSVSAPPGDVPPGDDGAATVERGLEARMHRMVLEPWVGPDVAADAPHILRSSNGAVAPALAASPEQPKPHDLLKDEITVLVEPGVAGVLVEGLGLCGTWVQLARVQDQGGGELNVPEMKDNLTEAQEARRGLRYWYTDGLFMIVPSYWAV